MIPHVKLFISSGAIEGIFGGGKWLLLDAVRREGSIHRAAESLGRSYRKAWGDIKRAEEGFGRPLVVKERGGSGGGKTVLTDFAIALLDAWDAYHAGVEAFARRSFDRFVTPVLSKPADAGTKKVKR